MGAKFDGQLRFNAYTLDLRVCGCKAMGKFVPFLMVETVITLRFYNMYCLHQYLGFLEAEGLVNSARQFLNLLEAESI